MNCFIATVLFCSYSLASYAAQSQGVNGLAQDGQVSRNAEASPGARVSQNGDISPRAQVSQNTQDLRKAQSGMSAEGNGLNANISLGARRREAVELWKQGRMGEAEKYYREILDADKKNGESSARKAADLYANGTLCVELDQLSEAKDSFQQALRLVRDQPVSTGEVLVSVGGVLALQGHFLEAESTYKSAVATLTKHAGANDLRTARAWNGLGWLYTAKGLVEPAGEALRKAKTIADRVLPPDSLARVPFLDYHAEYLSQVGRYAEAERLWRQALAIADESLKQGQPQYDVVLLHMGHMYEEIGQFKPAQEAMERFISIEQKAMPGGSLSQAVGLGELGNIYAHLKAHPEAEPTLMKSIDMLETMQGNVPLANALVGTYLGDYYMSQQRWTDAADQYRRVLTTREQLIPGTSLVANSMNRLSKALDKLKRKAEARQYRKAAKAILSEQHNPLYSGDTVDVKSFQAQ